MTIYMMTMPRNSVNKALLKKFIDDQDIHKWVIGYETGRTGYEHFQVRLVWGGSFEELKVWFDDAHIEEGSDDWRYERKEGYFVSSEDTNDVRRCRFGHLRDNQRRALHILDESGDRDVVVWYDRRGGVGKSFLTRYCYEKGLAYYVPPTIQDPKSFIQYVCAGYQGERYIIIDIPRTAQWSESLYTAIETIKDGLVYDTRYTARIRDIWGVKILALTNTFPKLGNLSKDRWRILNKDGIECTKIAQKYWDRLDTSTSKSTDSSNKSTSSKRSAGKTKKRTNTREVDS